MRYKLLNEVGGQKCFAVILKQGDRVMEKLQEFCHQEEISAAQITAIGAFSETTLGFFELSKKEYKHIPISEQCEVVSLVGDVTLHEQKPKIHAHVVVARSDGQTRGGHLLNATVNPTLEVIVTEMPHHLVRKMDEGVGIPLISIAE